MKEEPSLGAKGFYLGDEPYDLNENRVEIKFVTCDKDREVWSHTENSPLDYVSFFLCVSPVELST